LVSLKLLFIAILSLGIGLGFALAGTAAAGERSYSLGRHSGGQLQIGGGLPLPIQVVNKVPPTASGIPTYTGPKFPPLLIPRVVGAQVSQTTTATGMARKIMIPKGVLSKPAAFKILGQADNNPILYAVGTNITYTWPNAAVTLSTMARTGAVTTLYDNGGGRTITYSNILGRKFGGPAEFQLKIGPAHSPMAGAGPPGSVNSKAGATLYKIVFQAAPPAGGIPPCRHPSLGGADPACVAGLALALPTTSGPAAIGGGQPMFPVNVMTPGAVPSQPLGPIPGVGIVAAAPGPAHPTGPRGSLSLFAWTGGSVTGGTNKANSFGVPWTTGMLSITALAAAGAPETWKLTGADNRNADGIGRIQMVAGAVSTRGVAPTGSGDNGNRGWIRLDLESLAVEVPTLSPVALAAMAGLMLLAAGYTMRRRLSA
jgi:hypothetical protein